MQLPRAYLPSLQLICVSRTHPDRLSQATPAEKKKATEKFQVCLLPIPVVLALILRMKAVADAYYVLSDTTRRREYDALYASRSTSDRTNDPSSSASFFANFANMFTGAAGASAGTGTGAAPAGGEHPNAEGVFADVFDDVSLQRLVLGITYIIYVEQLLRPEVEHHTPWWSWFGAVSGGGVGFIVGNVPGLMVGAFAGNRLGAIRDAKGKSVAAVFSELGGNQKAEVRHVS